MKFIIHISCLIVKDNKILFVKEGKPQNYGKLNLPGGHLEFEEKLIDGAIRETKEETNLDVQINSLIGIYTSLGDHHFIHFVFDATTDFIEVMPLVDDVLDCIWIDVEAFIKLDDSALLNPEKLRRIVLDWKSGKRLPMEIRVYFLKGLFPSEEMTFFEGLLIHRIFFNQINILFC